MWNPTKERRLNNLLQLRQRNGLSSLEADELQSLTDERLRFGAESLQNSTRQMVQTSQRTREQTREVKAQSQALEELIKEQESYLAEVNSMIREMEARRRGWRTRYKRVTGRSLKEPISPAGIK